MAPAQTPSEFLDRFDEDGNYSPKDGAETVVFFRSG